MNYTVKSSEKLQPSASDAETKALLYLMGFRKDSNNVHYFIVDFFNDLTGMSRMSDKMWDVQSKGAKNSSPKKIGKELVTLFKNYMSEFAFDEYILFLGGVTTTLRKDENLNNFDVSNIKDKALENIKLGLKEESLLKTYINDKDITDNNIDNFINKVHFVIDDKQKSDYVKKIIKLNSSIIPTNENLIAIFNEIRDVQSSKKNSRVVENLKLSSPEEAINYGRHITASEIKLLVLNRILTENVISSPLPLSFLEIYNTYPEEKREHLLENCKLDFSKALFDSTTQEAYWKLFEEVYNIVKNNPKADVHEIFNMLDIDLKNRCHHFDVLSLKFFIAKLKDGIK